MNRYILLIILSFVIFENAKAQYDEHALRYSQSNISGTARTQAMGGANIALGADLSSANLNPAGLGLLRKGEFSITGSIVQANTNTGYLNTSTTGSKGFASIPTFGIVFSKIKDDIQEGKFRGGNFGITYTKTNNFQNTFNYSGENSSNSISDYFAEAATGVDKRTMDGLNNNSLTTLYQAAYKSDVIDPIYVINNNNGRNDTTQAPGNPYQFAWVPNKQVQSESVISKGGQYSWNFSYGANYNDRVYFGLGLGITKINYTVEKFYNEDFTYQPALPYPGLTNINIFEKYEAKGLGINIKGGVIAKATENFRLGISFTSPTIYNVNENRNYTFNSLLSTKVGTAASDYPINLRGGTNEFSLTTPYKVSPGVSYFFGKNGFITGEFDYVAYTTTHVGGNSVKSNYKADNDKIQNSFINTFNYRVGGEYRYDIFRFRLGFNYAGDPYKNKVIDRSMLSLTGGAGLRYENIYFDFAFVNSSFKSLYAPYTLKSGEAPVALIKNKLNTFNLTFGTFF